MRKWIVRLSVLAVIALAVFVLRRTAFTPDPILVKLASVERGRVESTVTNSKAGTVKARRRARLSPEASGTVIEVACKKGDRVEAGAVLVRLSDSLQLAQRVLAERELDAAQALHARACIATERALRELDRNRALAEANIVSSDVLDQLSSSYDLARASCTAAQADIERARAAIAVAQAELDKSVLRAPFAGVIAELSVERGDWVTPSPPLMPVPAVIDMIDTTSIYISAPMDEVDAAVFRQGQRAKVTLDPYPGRQFGARVVHVAPYVVDIESQNRTIEIEVELDDAPFASSLLPGSSADVEVILEARDGVLRIPTSSLIEGGKVLTIEDDLLVERAVEIGLRNWEFVEVRKGLEAGERIVTSLERAEVVAGARVVVENSAPGP